VLKTLLLLALSLPVVFAPAMAVSCGGRAPVRQAFGSASEVFSAYVEEIYTGPGFGRNDIRLARLRVLQAWKGSLKPGEVVSATAEDSIHFISDGFVPLQHSSVLVYASGTQPFMLHACSRTTSLEAGSDDIPVLNRLSRKREPPSGD
jgi:hypothetical protein